MPITTTCEDGIPHTSNDAGQLNNEGLAVYNGYSDGQPVANRYTTDLRAFTGAIVNAGGFNTRDWAWQLVGSGGVRPARQ